MTFADWTHSHVKKVDEILNKLTDLTDEEVVAYFNFDNMVEKEKDFCPLYETGTKCHDVDNLNCYFCGCPFFKNSDDKPMYMKDSIKVMSICTIGAKESSVFVYDGVQQCDCSKCDIPHKNDFVMKNIKKDISEITSLIRIKEYDLN